MSDRRRIFLVHAPTPIERRASLDELVGAKVWIKRDDVTSGAESGNKIRKLEFLLADAVAKKAEVVITCGGLQSNHARATALVCARLGMRAVLYLRVPDPTTALPGYAGNVLLDRLSGAEICFISPTEYKDRDVIMEHARRELAREGVPAYVVPEGGSNGLGSLGYVEAMREVKEQLDVGLCEGVRRFDVVTHACGSGGTAAGVALGAAYFDVAAETRAFCVCDDEEYFARSIAKIAAEARAWDAALPALRIEGARERRILDDARGGAEGRMLVLDDRAKGPAYGVMNDEQKRFLVQVARRSGLVLDPVYSGKALHGVAQAIERGDIAADANVLFIHTGGLPGLLAQGEDLASALDETARDG